MPHHLDHLLGTVVLQIDDTFVARGAHLHDIPEAVYAGRDGQLDRLRNLSVGADGGDS
jgi:hypothetical protein